MADKYCRSGAGGAGTGADWANAFTTLSAAAAGSAAGDDIWVAGDHAETPAGTTIAFPGTSASPNRVICVDHTGTVPPVSADIRTTATVTTNSGTNLTVYGTFYMEGISLLCSGGAGAGNLSLGVSAAINATLKNCALTLNTTNTAPRLQLGALLNSMSSIKLINTPMTFGSTSQACVISSVKLIWENTASALGGATFPTALFVYGSTLSLADVVCVGVDLSSMGSGKTLVNGGGIYPSKFVFRDCKLDAAVTVLGAPNNYGSNDVYLIRSSSSAVAYTHHKYSYSGTETIETTIVRTGGASVNGTAIAKKYVTTADAQYHQPFVAIPIAVANSTTGSNRVVTVYGVWGGGAVPTNADIWFDVSYLGSATSPQATFKTTAKADILAAASNHSTDSSTWGGSTTKFKMTLTLSSPQPAMAGEMYVQIYCGAASQTFYIDPAVVLS
jgi:hypothetical protein